MHCSGVLPPLSGCLNVLVCLSQFLHRNGQHQAQPGRIEKQKNRHPVMRVGG